mmetsp:Transcript_56158/g.182243  ORF Transcript_56158/g.182243 Transcript_56158/m.182243 type:complete len:791 (+) Transcript_56158:1638-4010(+)
MSHRCRQLPAARVVEAAGSQAEPDEHAAGRDGGGQLGHRSRARAHRDWGAVQRGHVGLEVQVAHEVHRHPQRPALQQFRHAEPSRGQPLSRQRRVLQEQPGQRQGLAPAERVTVDLPHLLGRHRAEVEALREGGLQILRDLHREARQHQTPDGAGLPPCGQYLHHPLDVRLPQGERPQVPDRRHQLARAFVKPQALLQSAATEAAQARLASAQRLGGLGLRQLAPRVPRVHLVQPQRALGCVRVRAEELRGHFEPTGGLVEQLQKIHATSKPRIPCVLEGSGEDSTDCLVLDVLQVSLLLQLQLADGRQEVELVLRARAAVTDPLREGGPDLHQNRRQSHPQPAAEALRDEPAAGVDVARRAERGSDGHRDEPVHAHQLAHHLLHFGLLRRAPAVIGVPDRNRAHHEVLAALGLVQVHDPVQRLHDLPRRHRLGPVADLQAIHEEADVAVPLGEQRQPIPGLQPPEGDIPVRRNARRRRRARRTLLGCRRLGRVAGLEALALAIEGAVPANDPSIVEDLLAKPHSEHGVFVRIDAGAAAPGGERPTARMDELVANPPHQPRLPLVLQYHLLQPRGRHRGEADAHAQVVGGALRCGQDLAGFDLKYAPQRRGAVQRMMRDDEPIALLKPMHAHLRDARRGAHGRLAPSDGRGDCLAPLVVREDLKHLLQGHVVERPVPLDHRARERTFLDARSHAQQCARRDLLLMPALEEPRERLRAADRAAHHLQILAGEHPVREALRELPVQQAHPGAAERWREPHRVRPQAKIQGAMLMTLVHSLQQSAGHLCSLPE